jgi:hypothetical protein
MTTSSNQRRPPSRLAFHASRIVIDVGVLVTMAAMSLRFVNGGAGNVHSVAADALPALLLLVPVFLITLIPDHSRPVPAPLGWPALLFGIAAFPYAIIKFIDASTIADTVAGSVGLGAYLLVAGTGVALAGIVLGLTRGAMRLPQGGAYPTRPPAPTLSGKSAPTTAAKGAAQGAAQGPAQGAAPRGSTPVAQPENRPPTPRSTRPRPPEGPTARRPILPDLGRPEDEHGGEPPP